MRRPSSSQGRGTTMNLFSASSHPAINITPLCSVRARRGRVLQNPRLPPPSNCFDQIFDALNAVRANQAQISGVETVASQHSCPDLHWPALISPEDSGFRRDAQGSGEVGMGFAFFREIGQFTEKCREIYSSSVNLPRNRSPGALPCPRARRIFLGPAAPQKGIPKKRAYRTTHPLSHSQGYRQYE